MKRIWFGLLLVALAWIAAMLHRGQPLGWDEIEFFRATRWIAEGQVPFRDFWEHHTPLQWIAFAPVAFFTDGPGAASIVTMRWAQVVLWVVILVLVMRLARDGARWWALVFLLAAPLFVRSAIEYRVDVPGNLGYIAAIALVIHRPTTLRWIAYGALMSIAVLANMRLAPLVIMTAIVMFFRREERWGFNPRALAMLAGVAAVALPFIGWLFAVDAWQPFLDGIVGYNVGSERLMRMDTLGDMLLAPVLLLDPAAIALWCAAIAGCVIALREIRMPGAPQVLAVLFVAGIVAISLTEVQYEYHFQTTYLLMVPLAATAFARVERWQWLAVAVAAVALLINLLPLMPPSFGEPMRYQDAVMKEVDGRTRPDDVVFDGTGYALRRKSAYRYWFLPVGLRFLAANGQVELYDIAANPPAAVIYNTRMQRWFEIFPRTAAYATSHYVPRYRNLWLPGMTATLAQGKPHAWRAPADGSYTLWASEALPRHPWFSKPLEYAAVSGPAAARYAIPLQQLPVAHDVLWSVDGKLVSGRTAELRKGARVAVLSREPRTIGVLLVPSGITTLAQAPAEEFQF
jgi:hypothetical protein